MRLFKKFAIMMLVALPLVFVACEEDDDDDNRSSSKISGMYASDPVYFASNVSVRYCVYDFVSDSRVVSYGAVFDEYGFDNSYSEFSEHPGWYYDSDYKKNLTFEIDKDRIFLTDGTILLIDGNSLLLEGTDIELRKWTR